MVIKLVTMYFTISVGCENDAWQANYEYSQCVVDFYGGCTMNDVYPLPNTQSSETVLVSSQTDFGDFLIQAVYIPDGNFDESQPNRFVMEGFHTVVPGSPKALTVDMSIRGTFPNGDNGYEGTVDVIEDDCKYLHNVLHVYSTYVLFYCIH